MDVDADPARPVQVYLSSRSRFDAVIAKEEVVAILKDLDPTLEDEAADALYQVLKNQNDRRIKEANFIVKSQLNSIILDDLSENVRDDQDDGNGHREVNTNVISSSDVDTLETAVNDLERLNNDVRKQRKAVELSCAEMLSQINEKIDDLSDLKYGKLDFTSTVAESMDSLERLQEKLLLKIDSGEQT